ncbi:MAG: Ni/Fe hydrogenase subunit alpha [Rhodospirillales bacterium]|nr:Ni/Fe hydrogenase subunit alpha [Rhodospirillales bacterium]
MREITIDPVTRIEGHAKITIHLDDGGKVEDARLHVTQVRGFEKFCEGRPYYEMPSLMARICGICPISHLLAASKACDQIMGVRIPTAAHKLRYAVHLGQMIQSHALSFFHLSAPDLLLGMDHDPATRNVVGLIQKHPELAKQGIQLRKFGQQIIEWLARERVHPSWIVPGGVNRPLDPEVRDRILAGIPEAMSITEGALKLLKSVVSEFAEEVENFGNFDSMHMGLVDGDGNLEFYDGGLRFKDAKGKILADQIPSEKYADYIGEAVVPWSYLKMPYYRPGGYPDGMYRVGPLARINAANACGTPKADKELKAFRKTYGPVAKSSFLFHYARLIEIIFSLEKLEMFLNEPDILDTRVRAQAGVNFNEGIGVSEAPRGTLIHHYKVDDNGLVTWANLIVATGNNNLAMNKSIKQVSQHFVDGNNIKEGMLNRVEAVVRAYDPCLSCSTHALGQMPMQLQLISPTGELLDEANRLATI